MQPHVPDGEVDTFAHGRLGVFGARADHDRLDAFGDGAEVGVARVALHLIRVRVDREDLVATRAQSLIDGASFDLGVKLIAAARS